MSKEVFHIKGLLYKVDIRIWKRHRKSFGRLKNICVRLDGCSNYLESPWDVNIYAGLLSFFLNVCFSKIWWGRVYKKIKWSRQRIFETKRVAEKNPLEVVRFAELVHQPLCLFSFLHLSLLVVLPEWPGELVVVHGGPVLTLAPQFGNPNWVHDLEDTLFPVQPVDATRIAVRLEQQLLQKLPKHDVWTALFRPPFAILILVLIIFVKVFLFLDHRQRVGVGKCSLPRVGRRRQAWREI